MLNKINNFLEDRTVYICENIDGLYVLKSGEYCEDEVIFESKFISDVIDFCKEWWTECKNNGLDINEIDEVEEEFDFLV